MSTKIETHLDFRGNQALNLVKHNLATAPSTPKEGQEYYNTATKKAAYWNGSEWVEDILIATDNEVATGTNTTKAINVKQFKTELANKEDKLGYVPENTSNKITTITESATDIQYPSAKAVYTKLAEKAPINNPTFTGVPQVPTAINGDNSLQIANTQFVTTAINNTVQGGMTYRGAWLTTNATDYSALNSFRPILKGSVFRCTGTGCTIDGVNYNEGDTIIFNRDVSTSTNIITASIDHYDHSLNEDVVLKDAVQALTNKTISAANNTITNLKLTNFDSTVIHTNFNTTSPSDKCLPTEKAIYTQLGKKATIHSPAFTGTPTATTPNTSDNSTKVATTAFVHNAITEAISGNIKKETYQNTLLTPVDGICTWAINHTLGTTDIICSLTEVATGNKIIMDEQATSSTVYTIKFNASASVSANTYKAVLIGV